MECTDYSYYDFPSLLQPKIECVNLGGSWMESLTLIFGLACIDTTYYIMQLEAKMEVKARIADLA